MGAWGALAFDNDEACDWSAGLEGVSDLSYVEETLGQLEEESDDYLDSDTACSALAACEVLARLRGKPGYQNAYTETVDQWVASHPQNPSTALLQRAEAAITRILGDESELRELWEDAEGTDADGSWRMAVADLQSRLK